MLKENSLYSLLKYLTAWMMLSVLLVPKFPLFSISGTFVAIRIEDIVTVLVSVVFLAIIVRDRGFLGYRITKYISLYLLIGFVSLLSAVFITNTIIPHVGVLHFVRRIQYFMPLFVGIYLIRHDKRNLNFFGLSWILAVIYIFIYGLGQRFFDLPIIITQNMEYSKGISLRWIQGSHINSTFAGHYDLAAFLVLTLPALVLFGLYAKNLLLKLYLLLLSFSGIWLLGYAASRIAIVSYFISLLSASFLAKKLKMTIAILIASLVILSFSPTLKTRYERIFTVLKAKISINFNELNTLVYASDSILPQKRETATPTPTPIPVFEDRSTSIRLKASWPKAFRAIEKNPLIGTGYSSVTLAVDNNYLRILGETGILGLLAFALIIFSISKSLHSLMPFTNVSEKKVSVLLAAYSGSLLGILTIALFIDIFLASKFAISFWFMTGLVLGSIYNEGKSI